MNGFICSQKKNMKRAIKRKKHILFIIIVCCIIGYVSSQEILTWDLFTWTIVGELTGLDNMSNTGEQTGEIPVILPPVESILPNLFITEVFFDGTDERVELTNKSNTDFIWNLILEGAKSTPINLSDVSISANTSRIFGDNILQIVDTMYIQKTGLAMSMTDTAPLNLSLWFSGSLLDTFQVDSMTVSSLPNKYGFEKIIIDWIYYITGTSPQRVSNISGDWIANPWIVYTMNIQNVTGEMPITEEFPIDCSWLTQQGLIRITEVFFGDSKYNPYIEISLSGDLISRNIQLSGSALIQNREIYLDPEKTEIDKNNIILLSDNENWYLRGINNGYQQGLKLGSTWGSVFLSILSGQTRQVLDIVYIISWNTGTSLYFQGHSQQCARVLDKTGIFSPGFDHKFLEYFPLQNSQVIQYIMTGNGQTSPCPSLASGNIPPLTSNNDIISLSPDNIANNTNSIKIVNIEPKTPESISLYSWFPEKINFENHNYFLKKKSSSGEIYTNTKRYLYETISSGETKTFYKSFWFLDGGWCVWIFSWELLLDELCYGQEQEDPKIPDPGVQKQIMSSWYYTVTSVLDGDTFRIKYQGKTQSIRLIWADAPESNKTRYRVIQCFGKEAKNYLTGLLKGKQIRLEFDSTQWEKDIYNRLLAYVYLDDELVNEKIIADGFAREYTYKTAYKYQESFQNAQKEAQSELRGLRGPNACGEALSSWVFLSGTENSGTEYSKYSIDIQNLIYDPPGADAGNESLLLRVNAGEDWAENIAIDLSDGFYLLINDKKKFLKSFWILAWKEEYTLTGTFWFPNEKETSVSLYWNEYLFDTREYVPNKDTKIKSWTSQIISGIEMRITSLLPNPLGKDQNKEEIKLSFTSIDAGISNIDLSQGRYLMIWEKKKKLSGMLQENIETAFTWSFWFPNTSSCIRIGRGNEILDTMCYSKPLEGDSITKNNWILSSLSSIDLWILNHITLEKQADKLCLSYWGQIIKCKNIPAGKLTTQKSYELKLLKNYTDAIESYIKKDWGTLYYNTPMRSYVDIYRQAKKVIENWEYVVELHHQCIPVYDIQSRYEMTTPASFVDIIMLNLTNAFIGNELQEKYQTVKKEYYKYLDSW